MEEQTKQAEETFEQKCAREKEERNEKIRKFNKRAVSIAKALGWSVKRPGDLGEYSGRSVLSSGTSEIWLVTGSYNLGWDKVEVSGNYPRTKKGEYVEVWASDLGKTYTGTVIRPKIRVTLKKTDDQIAAEIKRRFLPGYNVILHRNTSRGKTRSRISTASGSGSKSTAQEQRSRSMESRLKKPPRSSRPRRKSNSGRDK